MSELTPQDSSEYEYYQSFNLNPKSWDKAVTAKEAVASMPCDILESELLEWADSMLCPHYRINNGQPMFNKTKLKEWITHYKVNVCNGKPLCDFVSYQVRATEFYRIPDCLLGIEGLIEANLTTVFSGVYFLCRASKVVYVGQAQSVSNRIGNHGHEGVKNFDSAFCIPVSFSLLNAVEQYYIKNFLPEYNNCAMSKKAKREAIASC